MNVPEYNPIAEVERVASEIAEFYPCASIALLMAATAIGVLLDKSRRDEQDRLALAQHWGSCGI